MSDRDLVKLSEEQMRDFVANGYISLKPDLPESFHREIYETTEKAFERVGNPGNNILPMVPQLQQVFDHPQISGALTGILGENYYLHPHRHCHFNKPSSEGQTLHKDSWSRFQHRTRWAMAFYYPQDTPVERGPTGIVPGSHYYNGHPSAEVGEEIPLWGEAGSLTIVHYDLWHRATPNVVEQPRYMVKFLFVRVEEPTAPTWEGKGAAWDTDNPMWNSVWNWHRGATPANGGVDGDPEALLKELGSEDEMEALQAAYGLARGGQDIAENLSALLGDESDYVRRNAGYALSAMDGQAVPALMETLSDADVTRRATAADVLGDIGRAAGDSETLLVNALRDGEQVVRLNAAHALGTVSGSGQSAGALAETLGCEEDEWVRRYAALSLLRLGRDAADAVPQLKQAALTDPNRYVQAKSLEALQRMGTSEATSAAFDILQTLRWCPHTGIGSGF